MTTSMKFSQYYVVLAREAASIWRENEVDVVTLLGTLRSDDGGSNGNVKKAIGLLTKTTTLHVHHAFLYVSLQSLHDYDVKMANFTFYRGSTQATTKFLLSFRAWIWFLGIPL